MNPAHKFLRSVSYDVCDNFSVDAYLFVRENLLYLIKEISDVIPGKIKDTLWKSIDDKMRHYSVGAFFGMDSCEQLSANLRIIFFPENKLGIISHDFHINGNIYQKTWSDIMFETIDDARNETQNISMISFDDEFLLNFEWYIDTYVDWVHSEDYNLYKNENWIQNESNIFLKPHKKN